MTTSTDAAAGRFGPLPARPGQDHRDPPELRVPRRPARPPPGGAVVLLQAVELGGGIRRHDRAPRRHGAARLRGRDRPRDRRARPARPARGRVEPCRVRDRVQRLRPVRPARERQGLQRPLEGRRRVHADRAGAARRARARPRRAAAAHLGQRRARAGRHHGGADLPPRPAGRRPLAALHARDRRCDPHRHSGGILGRRPGRRRRGRGRRPRARPVDRPPGHHGDAGVGILRRVARLAPRRRRHPARRGLGLPRGGGSAERRRWAGRRRFRRRASYPGRSPDSGAGGTRPPSCAPSSSASRSRACRRSCASAA